MLEEQIINIITIIIICYSYDYNQSTLAGVVSKFRKTGLWTWGV